MQTVVFGSFVAGRVVEGSGPRHPIADPSTGRVWAESIDAVDKVDEALAAASTAVESAAWRDMDPTQRGRLMLNLADLIEQNADALAPMEVRAAGKLLKTTQREMARAAAWYRFFGGMADKIAGQSIRLNRTAEAKTVPEPVGVVVAITPFNGPFSLGAWKMAPALAAGNTIVVKPPLECPGTSLMLGQLAEQAGFPSGVINVVPGGVEAGMALVSDPRTDMITFTGSSATARIIGAEAGSRMKRFVCEAGGKSAHIVFDDADLESALIAARQGVFSNAGQTCVAGSRLLVHRSHYDSFVETLTRRAGELRLGDPLDPSTHIGPLASAKQFDRVSKMVATAASSHEVIGGGKPDLASPFDGGFFFNPTIVLRAAGGTEVWAEEVFGPVVTIVPFDDEGEAVALANDSQYGLAAGMWTRSAARADRVSRRIKAGTVWVNAYRMMDYRVPFGGYRQSGLGRENGVDAIREFQIVKAIVADHAPPVDPFAY